MKNWKTTLFGLLMALASGVTTGIIPTNPTITKIAAGIQVVAGGSFAVSAKDKNVTGGTVQQ